MSVCTSGQYAGRSLCHMLVTSGVHINSYCHCHHAPRVSSARGVFLTLYACLAMIPELSDIDETTTLEERQDLYIDLLETGWSREECAAVTGLEHGIGAEGREYRIVDLVPTQGGMQ